MRTICLLIALLLPLTAMAEPYKGYRNFIWGVSPEDVRTYEKAVFYEKEGTSLKFLEDKKGQRAQIRYDFEGGKLWRVEYEYVDLFNTNYQDMFDFVMDEQRKLAKQFGDVTDQQMIWKNKKYKNHPKFWRRAYAYGDLTIITEWKDDQRVVIMKAFRDRKSGIYHVGYTIENPVVASQREAAKAQEMWN